MLTSWKLVATFFLVAVSTFVGWIGADDVVLAVAEVGVIAEVRSVGLGFVCVQSGEAVTLIQATDRGGDVFQFFADRLSDFSETHDQTEYGDRGDQDQFGGDHKTSFVVEKILHDGTLS